MEILWSFIVPGQNCIVYWLSSFFIFDNCFHCSLFEIGQRILMTKWFSGYKVMSEGRCLISYVFYRHCVSFFILQVSISYQEITFCFILTIWRGSRGSTTVLTNIIIFLSLLLPFLFIINYLIDKTLIQSGISLPEVKAFFLCSLVTYFFDFLRLLNVCIGWFLVWNELK